MTATESTVTLPRAFAVLAAIYLDDARRGWGVHHNRLDSDGKPIPGTLDPDVDKMIANVVSALRASTTAARLSFDLIAHLERQSAWSLETFGPGVRTAGVVDHIRKELWEIEADPHELGEWVDVILLAFDGAWRAGFKPEDIASGLALKLAQNMNREWPDWRTVPKDKAIEHVRTDAEG